MTKKDLGKSFLKRVEKEHIKPTPKWEFLLKRSALWVTLGITIIFGAISVSIIAFLVETEDWEVYERINSSLLRFAFENLPYVWLVVMGFLVFLAYYNFKHTKKAYKYNRKAVISIGVIIIILVGVPLFHFGFAKKIENEILNDLPFYKQLHHQNKLERWLQVEKGLLAGEVTEEEIDARIKLEDFNDKEWIIILPDTEVPRKPIKIGMKIRVVGEKIDEYTFSADNIMPWQRNFLNRKQMHKMPRNNMPPLPPIQ